jgi:hypothetical protein
MSTRDINSPDSPALAAFMTSKWSDVPFVWFSDDV